MPRRPNVVIILADDQGWGDLSINGNTNLATPHIDSLARTGAMFDRFYACPVCSPTRAEFLTGRYHPRGGVSGVSSARPVMPMIPFMGVRISWLITARNSLLAWLAACAARMASIRAMWLASRS